MGKDSWAGIREKVFRYMKKIRKVVMTPKEPEKFEKNHIYIENVRNYKMLKKGVGGFKLGTDVLSISSLEEFILPEFAYLDASVDLIEEGFIDGKYVAYYSIGKVRQFSNLNAITRQLLKDNLGRMEYQSK